MVEVTEKAKSEIKKVVVANNAEFLRISFGGYGWSGPRFDMTLDKSSDSNDEVYDYNDFKIAISKDFASRVGDLVVDYSNGFLGKGFTVSEKGKESSGCC